MKVQVSIDLHAEPEKVWPYLYEPDKAPQWIITYQRDEFASDQHSGVGTRFYVEEKSFGPLMKVTFEASEWVENQKLVLKMISGTGLKTYQQTMLLEKLEQGCRFTFSEVVELPMGFLGRFIATLGEGASHAALQKALLKLKALVEG